MSSMMPLRELLYNSICYKHEVGYCWHPFSNIYVCVNKKFDSQMLI